MPQMFPMPFTFLMFMVTMLFLLSAVRAYWYIPNPHHLNTQVSPKVSLHFYQIW